MVKEKSHFKIFILAAVISAFSVGFIGVLLQNIFEKKQEAESPYHQIVKIDDTVDDPRQWGINFPHQFASYLKTVDQVRTRYGGSEALYQTPSKADPRSIVAQSRLEEDPRLKIMWSGYAFSEDFREERGHAYMLADQEFTKRQHFAKQPGACVNCHASTYTAMKKLGDGDLFKGFEKINKMPYLEARSYVSHAVSCIDCHTPKTMQLRVTKPAFIEAIRIVKQNEGIKDFDVNKMASPQQMRTFVCAQCHVEYYFKGQDKRLTFPWHNGFQADQILAYYNKEKFKDWVHKETDAPVLKAQHPEFEMWNMGTHARSGVSCTDCHMPYERVGAMKITDHHIRSPVLNIQRSCQTCHHWPEQELKARIETIQGRTFEMRGVAMEALVAYINDLKSVKKKLAPNKLEQAYQYQRRAQFLLDFVEAENSMGFHAPEEALRLLGLSIDASRRGQVLIKTRVR